MFDYNGIYNTIKAKENIYNDIISKTHKVDVATANRIYTAELETFLTRLQNYAQDPNAQKGGNPTLTVAQGVNIFLEVMQSGLSFSATANHVYISRLKGTGTAVGYQLTADGLIYKAQKSGAIDHLSEPVIVQIGEQFTIKSTEDGRQIADHVMRFDGKPAFNFDQLLLGYIYIIYPNGNRELSWISKTRLEEYRSKSLNRNMYNDESFIQTKIIKHALRKVRKSDFMMQLQAEDDEVIAENMEWTEPTTTATEETQTNNTNEPF